VRRKTFDTNGSVVELVHAVYRGDRYDYVIWLERRRG
jgi:DNA-binding GntR family transcriptional regulator